MRMLCQFDVDVGIKTHKVTKQIFKGAAFIYYDTLVHTLEQISKDPVPYCARFRGQVFIDPEAYVNFYDLSHPVIITEESPTYDLFVQLRDNLNVLRTDVRLINQYIITLELAYGKDRQKLRNAIPDILTRFFNLEDIPRTAQGNYSDKFSPNIKKMIEDRLDYYCSLSVFMETKYGQVFDSNFDN